MKRLLVLVVLGTGLLLAGLARNGSGEASTRYIEGDGFKGVILTAAQAPTKSYLSREEVIGFWSPSTADIDALEARLRATLEEAHVNPALLDPLSATNLNRREYVSREIGKILDHLTEYRRQYLGIRLSDSKRIWVNFFPGKPADRDDPFDFWRERLVMVLDGGFWYWSIQFDPHNKTFVEFYSNGYA